MLDLHGAEVQRVERARAPISVGPSSIIGLVGSAPSSQGAAQAAAEFGAGASGYRVTAINAGRSGNLISITVIDPGTNSSVLTIAVDDQAISVSLATNNTGDVTTTALQLVTALNAHAAARLLVLLAVTAVGGGLAGAEPTTPLDGGRDDPFPIGVPVLLTAAAQSAALGSDGALPPAVRDCYLTAGRRGAAIVVVRTGDDLALTLAGGAAPKTGVYALLNAESVTGQRPRLIAAPGAQDDSVTTALQSVAEILRGVAVVTIDAATVAAAVGAAPGLSHVVAAWPELIIVDDGAEVTRPADGLMLGHVARIDRDRSFAASPSNHLLQGVLRTAVGVNWTLDSRTSDANILNRGHLVTAIRRGAGTWFWGNRMSDGELISKRRADDLIGDQLLDAVLDYIDRQVDLPFVEHVLGRLNGYLRTLVLAGHIRAGRAWFDPLYNEAATIAAAVVTFSFELTLHDIAEHIVIRSSVGSVPSDILDTLTID